jgi:predicted Zn-dependent protease
MYAAGYDPNGAISIFEKLEALERNKPGVVSKLFATHPMDADRIAKAQAEINRILPSRPDYTVTTSEYSDMRHRLMRQEQGRKADADPNRPTLRVRTEPNGPADPAERPTVRRRELID